MPSPQHLAIEGAIARSHKSLTLARDLSSALSDLGLHDDLQLVLIELERLQVDLLRSNKPRRLRAAPQPVSEFDRGR